MLENHRRQGWRRKRRLEYQEDENHGKNQNKHEGSNMTFFTILKRYLSSLEYNLGAKRLSRQIV